MIAIEVMEMFTALESNHTEEVNDVKNKFHEQFNSTRDPWLLNGMYDYFMATGSQKAVEIIVAVGEPHDKYLFDRLLDGLRSTNRLQALTLLGHVVKRNPSWLIKITNHSLLKELIKLLWTENEIIAIISALLVLNVLLTVIPALISSFLPEIFDGFSRLAAWNSSQKNRVPEIHLFHLQISLYVLFVQLYSMYPCSFVSFLKKEYTTSDKLVVFTHTIKPMIETMRMHPNLITSSKEVETSINRWKQMEQHDVVMECTRYTLLENSDRNDQNSSTWNSPGSNFSSALEKLKSSVGAIGGINSVNSIRNKDLWSPMLSCEELYKDNVKSMPTTPNIQTYYKTFNHNEHSPPEAAIEATPETTPIRMTDSSKDSYNARSESKPIIAQIQPTNNPEIIQTEDEDLIECDQQSNGSPCQTHEGGLHMPDSTSLKEFVRSVRKRERYYSQCASEIDTSEQISMGRVSEFTSHVRRANSCPEIKKTNGSSISSGTSPLQEEIEEDHINNINISNGHTCEIPRNNLIKDAYVSEEHAISKSTQTEHILPYEHLFYSIFPAYNDPHNNVNNQQSTNNSQEDESLCLIEKYVRTSAIVLNHRHTAESSDNVKLLQDQISLLTLQLQFERNRREVHAERNRRLLGKSRNSRAVDEHNAALRDQVMVLQGELEHTTSRFEELNQKSTKQVKDLKETVSFLQIECLKFQEETEEANKKCLSLEQLYNEERLKTVEVTKRLSETKAELFNTKSELTIVQAAADVSKDLKNTVANLQRELVICGEIQSRQRDVVTHVNTLRYDASSAMLSQESYRHNLNKLQEMLYYKSAMLEASNAHIADLELKLVTKQKCIQNDKREIESVKVQFNNQLSELKKECKALKEIQYQYEENKKEEESKQKFLEEISKLSSDIAMVNSNISMNVQEAEFRYSLMSASIDDGCDNVSVTTLTPK